MLFRITGKEPKFFSVPVALMDFIIGLLEAVGKVIPPVGVRAPGPPFAKMRGHCRLSVLPYYCCIGRAGSKVPIPEQGLLGVKHHVDVVSEKRMPGI